MSPKKLQRPSNSKPGNDVRQNMVKLISPMPAETDQIATPTHRRSKVPARPNKPANLWAILKNSVGKDLSKVPMPVNFSEPLSMLQRLAEDFEYSDLLDQAANCKDSLEQLAYLAVFTISSYGCTSQRISKPFNPLLGETFECDRRSDFGWRSIAEQVSHHPPISAQHVEGKQWKCWQEFSMSSKFRGKYITITPLGVAQCKFNNGNHYSWRKVTTNVNNVMFGKMWVDNCGNMEILCHTNNAKCHLNYLPYNASNKSEQRRVIGEVKDSKGRVFWNIDGIWDHYVQICPSSGSDCLESYKVVWTLNKFPVGAEKFYNFTVLACQLNELEAGVAPTDSRLRPDQRLMEDGKWDEANDMKTKLEEKQRQTRKEREEGKRGYEPVWFKPIIDPVLHIPTFVYRGGYWEAKSKKEWSLCPAIFSVSDMN